MYFKRWLIAMLLSSCAMGCLTLHYQDDKRILDIRTEKPSKEVNNEGYSNTTIEEEEVHNIIGFMPVNID